MYLSFCAPQAVKKFRKRVGEQLDIAKTYVEALNAHGIALKV